jgi:hypothetical protein
MRIRTSVAAVAGALALLGAGSANAATLTLDGSQSCYRAGDTLSLTGSGFTAGGVVDVKLDGGALGTVAADSAGNFSTPLKVGSLEGVETHTVSAVDEANPTISATVSFLGSALAVEVSPRNGKPGRMMRLRASGFTTGDRLYAHITRKGRTRNLFVADLKGPCHTAKVRRRLLPASLATGVYKVQFDTKRHLSRRTATWVRFRVTVKGAERPKPKPRRQPNPSPQPQPTNCQGYSPCIPPGPDVDCAGGSGDGPRYRSGPIYVSGSDPYGLDSDGDGVACES